MLRDKIDNLGLLVNIFYLKNTIYSYTLLIQYTDHKNSKSFYKEGSYHYFPSENNDDT